MELLHDRIELTIEVDDTWFPAPESFRTALNYLEMHEIRLQTGLNGTPFDNTERFSQTIGGVGFLFQLRLYEAFIVLRINENIRPAWLREALIKQIDDDAIILPPSYLHFIWRTFRGRDQRFVNHTVRKMATQVGKSEFQQYRRDLERVINSNDELRQSFELARSRFRHAAEVLARLDADLTANTNVRRQQVNTHPVEARAERIADRIVTTVIVIIALAIFLLLSWGLLVLSQPTVRRASTAAGQGPPFPNVTVHTILHFPI